MKFTSLAMALFAGLAFGQSTLTTSTGAVATTTSAPPAVTTITTTLIVIQPPAVSQTTNSQTSTQFITMTMTVTPSSTSMPVVTTTMVVTQDPISTGSPSKSTVTMTFTVQPTTASTVTQTVTLLPPPPPTTVTQTVVQSSSSSIVTAITITKTETADVTKVTTTLTPNQPVAVYKRFSCNSQVTCPSGTKYVYDNGAMRKCTSTYYNNVLASSTCVKEHCCTAEDPVEIVTLTNCKKQNVNCGNNMQLAVDSNGNSVPCMVTSKGGNKQYRNTCTRDTCCVSKVHVVTSTQTVVTTMVNTVTVNSTKRYLCSQFVKCKVYKKNNNGSMVRCTPGDAKQPCSYKRCCKS